MGAKELEAKVQAVVKRVDGLEARWRSEHEYEQFSDYAMQMCKTVRGQQLVFVSASKKPFGCKFKTQEGQQLEVIVKGKSIVVNTYK